MKTARRIHRQTGVRALLLAALLLLVTLVTGNLSPAQAATPGTVVAWGDNIYGESTVPAGLYSVIAIAAGDSHSLALKSDGTVVAWGDNSSGQVSNRPTAPGYIAIAAGSLHSLALKSDGTVVAWGDNDAGQSDVPVGLSGVTAIAAGTGHSLALKSDGTVVAWGDNSSGQVSNRPTGLGYTAIAAGGLHNLALVPDTTPPTITASAIKADNTPYTAGTWTNQNVTVHFTCSDDLSGIATCPGDQVISPEGIFTATGTATDNVGNSASMSFGPIQIDKTTPTITASATKVDNTPYSAGTWANQTVTVHFTCSDAGSGIASCPGDQVFSSNGFFLGGGAAYDNAGNLMFVNFGSIGIDKTAPTITASAQKADNTPYIVGTWTSQTVTVHFTCSDADSGLASACPGDQVISPNGIFTATSTVADNAGNNASASFGPIQIDKTAPTITASGTKADNTPYTVGTWTNQNVTVHFTCSDTPSGIATCPGDQVISPNGIFTATGTVTDNAGNTANASFGPIQIDKTAPTVTASATKADSTPYTAGTWTNQNVLVHFTCSDADSGLASACPGDQVISLSGIFTATGTVADNAGNSASANFGPIQIDKAKPVITGSRTPAANANGWNNTDVVVGFTCADNANGSGLTTNTVAGATVSTEGANQSITNTGVCADGVGNTADPATSSSSSSTRPRRSWP